MTREAATARLGPPRAPAAPGGRPGEIAADLGCRIVDGSLAPGEVLPAEFELLAYWRVSRTTLREAFKLLTAKGLVSARPKRGTVVRPPEDWNLVDPDVLEWLLQAEHLLEQTVTELFAVRQILEPEAAALAAAQGGARSVDEVRVAYERLAEGADAEDNLSRDVAFHRAILTATGNRFLRGLSPLVETALLSTARLSRERPGGLRFSLPQHEVVMRAIVAKEPESAREAMSALIENARADALSFGRGKRKS